jgi:hypothetical protein
MRMEGIQNAGLTRVSITASVPFAQGWATDGQMCRPILGGHG